MAIALVMIMCLSLFCTALAVTVPTTTRDGYADAVDLYYEVTDAMRNFILDSPELAQEEYISSWDIKDSVFPFSTYMSLTRDFCEDQERLDKAVSLWMNESNFKDTQFIHDAPNDYRLTGIWLSRNASFEVTCQFDPRTGALQMSCHDEQDESGWASVTVEFMPLGGGVYAAQMIGTGIRYHKALITYRNGKLEAFDYFRYASFADVSFQSIFPDAQGLDSGWVYDDYAIGYPFTYDGQTLQL